MLGNYLKSIEGVAAYPIISLFVFFIFFLVIVIWVLKVDRNYINRMKNLPLDSTDISNEKSTGENNV
jgi:cbb3-type cytochrome oxidase subunit 3